MEDLENSGAWTAPDPLSQNVGKVKLRVCFSILLEKSEGLLHTVEAQS
jgi:hypothetical protein